MGRIMVGFPHRVRGVADLDGMIVPLFGSNKGKHALFAKVCQGQYKKTSHSKYETIRKMVQYKR